MRFLAPNLLWMLLPVSLLPVVWYLLEKHAEKNLARFASPELFSTLIKDIDFKRRRLKFVFEFLALVFAVLALARPQMGSREEILKSEGLDIAVLLDVSNSMLAEDIVPSRLKKAKHVIKTLVERLSGDRVGVVAFAGSAYPAVPLTTDYEYILQTLDVVNEESISNQGSNLARAVETGMDLLVRGGMNDDANSTDQSADASSRVMIVISDGEATEGEESNLAPRLKERGIKVFSIGVGSVKGGPIPLRDQMGYLRGYKKDRSGNMVLTKLENKNLEGIASKTGGKFYAASSNEGEIDEILEQMSSLDRNDGQGRRVIVYEELFQYPLALALVFFLLMLLMRESRVKKGPRTAGVALSVLIAVGTAQAHAATSISEYDATKKGMKAYDEGDFAGAVQRFGKAQASSPESNLHHMNLGDALFKAGAPEAAIAEFEHVAKSKDSSEAARGAYNLGKAYEAAKNREKALQAYQSGLDRLKEAGEKADPEAEMRIKKALEQAASKSGDGGDGQDQNSNNKKDDQSKDGKSDQQKDKNQPPAQMPKTKPQFKAEKLSESDAKRILQQLSEQEKKSQQRVMRGKTGKPESEKTEKDW